MQPSSKTLDGVSWGVSGNVAVHPGKWRLGSGPSAPCGAIFGHQEIQVWSLNLTIHWSTVAPCPCWPINTLADHPRSFFFERRNPHFFTWLQPAVHLDCHTGFLYKTCSVRCPPTVCRNLGGIAWVIKPSLLCSQKITNMPAMIFSIVEEEDVDSFLVHSVSKNIEGSSAFF